MDRESIPPQDPASLPRGIVFFRSDATPAHRRRRTTFLVLFVLIGSLVLWPVFPFFARVFPLVLGLPFSFAWVVMALAAMFFVLLWLFLTEDHRKEQGEG